MAHHHTRKLPLGRKQGALEINRAGIIKLQTAGGRVVALANPSKRKIREKDEEKADRMAKTIANARKTPYNT